MAGRVAGIAAIVVMGVSGAGKSTVGKLIAARLDCPFRDADSFHPKANIEKMSRGAPLTDEDRWPWLRSIGERLSAEAAAGRSVVVTCSALRRAYRDLLREVPTSSRSNPSKSSTSTRPVPTAFAVPPVIIS